MSSLEVTVSDGITVEITESAAPTVTVTEKGPKGDTGADGQGVPTGGSQFQLLRKVSGDDYDTTWDYADRVTLEVRFDEAVSKGDPLYITGFNNGQNRITVAKADASDSSKMPSIGLAFADYSQNDNGQATSIGSLDDVNTQVSPNDFQEGDVLYVKAGGGLTNVKPTGTNLIQNVGKVGRRQQNNGEIVVMAIGRSNDVPNIPNGQAWIGNASGVATPTTLATVATSGDYDDLSNKPTRGGTYSYSGYSTDVTKTATFYYQFPSATSSSSTTDMISSFVGQGTNNATFGTNGAITLDGLSSTDSATYSMTLKITTNATLLIQTSIPTAGQFVSASAVVTSSASEQTVTLTQSSPTNCNGQGGAQWVMGLSVAFAGGGSADFRVSDLSITVS